MSCASRTFRFATMSLCIAVIGCADIKQVGQNLVELWDLRSQIMKAFDESDVSLKVANGRHLAISLFNSPLKGLSKMEKRMKAREIACFAAQSYKPQGSLESVSVAFVTRKSFLMFHFTDSTDYFRFKATDLTASTQSPASEMSSSQFDGENPYLRAQALIDNYRGHSSDLEQAHEILKRILDYDPENAPAYVGMCRLSYKWGYIRGDKYDQKALEEARGFLDRALNIDPNLYDAYYYGTYLYAFSNDMPKAREFAMKAQEMEPDSAKTGVLFAFIAASEKDYDEVIRRAETVLSQTTDRALLIEAHRQLEGAYRGQKQHEKMESNYLKQIELAPEDPWLLDRYGSLLYSRGDYDKAIEFYEKALSIMDFGVARSHAGKAYYKKGGDLLWKDRQPDASLNCFLKAVEYEPTPNAYYGLGMAYWGSGDAKRDVALIKKAEEALAKAVELDPEHKQATKHLKDLRERFARHGMR